MSHPEKPVCDDCGQVHDRCARHNRHGEPCRNYPKRGTTVCTAPTHGGRLPRVKAAAERAVVEADITATARRLADAAPITDPLAELAKFAGEVKAWKDIAAERVESLQGQIRYTAGGQGTEQLRAEVAVLERALAEFRKTLVDIARLDIDNRLARISEAQAVIIVRIIVSALEHAGVTGTPLAEAKAFASRELEAVA